MCNSPVFFVLIFAYDAPSRRSIIEVADITHKPFFSLAQLGHPRPLFRKHQYVLRKVLIASIGTFRKPFTHRDRAGPIC